MLVAEPVELQLSQAWFLPVGVINALRREATEKLIAARLAAHQRPPRAAPAADPCLIRKTDTNLPSATSSTEKARAFYEKHSIKLMKKPGRQRKRPRIADHSATACARLQPLP